MIKFNDLCDSIMEKNEDVGMMTYKQAITFLKNNAKKKTKNDEWKKAVATQIVGIRTAQEIERKAS